MKVSVSLPESDITFVDDYARRMNVPSRSAVLHKALELLRMDELEEEYSQAWDEWEGSDDAALWDQTSSDGLADAAG
ncbi:hypothetical protein LX16_3667 [Stackebrandtia albiflava]|uniref:Ribbon-helix-helix CopG family protein n=1 Tax=Stackebrandtia albiflava TaxID=406432 RepID=A0A562V4V0_9ACTN|nr:antitoxin [Stackebrandtia albiflava]TWJ12900.1 hypothetical protein LX16_3667 [Stackebrandtia albiflava]